MEKAAPVLHSHPADVCYLLFQHCISLGVIQVDGPLTDITLTG